MLGPRSDVPRHTLQSIAANQFQYRHMIVTIATFLSYRSIYLSAALPPLVQHLLSNVSPISKLTARAIGKGNSRSFTSNRVEVTDKSVC